MKSLILITCLLQTAFAAPQLITFKDGKIGVNLFGYHAEAGGGGQSSQNAGLFGGLHASAGTPWGQNAAAGLGGNINGRAAGVLYAGAQATPDIGANAILGGDTHLGGFGGSEAYANGKVASKTRTIVAGNTYQTHDKIDEEHLPPQHLTESVNVIQKIRPPKKYYSSETLPHTHKAVIFDVDQVSLTPPPTAPSPTPVEAATQSTQSLNIDTSGSKGNNHYHQQHQEQYYNNEFNTINTTPLASVSSLTSAPTSLPLSSPTTIHSSISLSHLNENNSNGITAKGVTDDTTIIITKDKNKLRSTHRKHPLHLNRQRQRQRSKTIIKVVEQEQHQGQHQLQTAIQQQNHNPEDLLPRKSQQKYPQIHLQQQRPARRQLIAQPPAYSANPLPSCDNLKSDCQHGHKEVRSDIVQSALQIPIGILQSLQQSLGNFGRH